MSRIAGSPERRGKGRNNAHGGEQGVFDFASEAGHFLGANRARDWRELPERVTVSRTCNREASLTPGMHC